MKRMPTRRAVAGVALLALVALAAACGRSGGDEAASRTAESPSASRNAAGMSAVDAIPAHPDPCSWLTREEVAAIVGPVQPAPQRVYSLTNLEARDDGSACLYQTLPPGSDALSARIVVSVDPTGNLAVEDVGKILNARIAKDAPGTVEVDTTREGHGWDASSWLIDTYHARLGSLAVEIGTPDWATAKIGRDTIERLAAAVRDRIPDKPFTGPEGSQRPDGDPCSLLSASEVETIAGSRLVQAPFRSYDADPLADDGGAGCTYWLGHHRALSISVEWSNGKELFQAATMMGNLMNQKLGLTGQSADTLDGAWDQVAAAGGGLVFLSGDKMLKVSAVTAHLDAAGSVQVAAKALARLAKQD